MAVWQKTGTVTKKAARSTNNIMFDECFMMPPFKKPVIVTLRSGDEGEKIDTGQHILKPESVRIWDVYKYYLSPVQVK